MLPTFRLAVKKVFDGRFKKANLRNNIYNMIAELKIIKILIYSAIWIIYVIFHV